MFMLPMMMKMIAKKGYKLMDSFEEMTKDPMKVQKELLNEIIENSKDTVYGKEHNFINIKSIEDFQKYVPINDYDSLVPYIERNVKGEQNILTGEEVVFFNRTSGTLGIEKKIPLVEKQISIFKKYNTNYFYGLASKNFGYDWMKGKGLSLTEGTYEILECGIPYGCASSVMTSRMDKMGPFKDMMGAMYTSPREARVPAKGVLTRYIHARFALMEENITYAVCTFSSNLMETMRYIENNWKMLVNDIRTGTIDESIDLPDDVKASLLKKCKKMPKRADLLESVFSKGFNEPFAKKIWPNFVFIFCAAGASFQPYTDRLVNNYLGKEIKVMYLGLSASEGYFSVASGVENPDSILVADACFLEFLNVDKNKCRDYLTMDKLEVGELYELVITSRCGLYRYRMKDVIKVTGMKNNTPLVQFMYREGYAINMFGEKTSELAILNTVKNTGKQLNIDIYDYSAYADVDNARYVFLLELAKDNPNVTNEQIRKTLQDNLIISNDDIKEEFEIKHLNDCDVKFLQPETYLLYRDLMVLKGASASQLKPVHVIMNEKQRAFFFGLTEDR